MFVPGITDWRKAVKFWAVRRNPGLQGTQLRSVGGKSDFGEYLLASRLPLV